jgi:signal transduction histidine kinase
VITTSLPFNPSIYREIKTIVLVHFVVIALVSFWDVFGLHAKPNAEYLSVRLAFIFAPLLSIWMYRTNSLRFLYSTWFSIVVFTYSYYYMVNLHYSYYSSFIQYFLALTVIMRYEIFTFAISYIYGIALFIVASNSQTILDIVDSGHNIQSDMFSTIVPSILFATIFFFQITKVRKRIEKDEMIFTALGKNTSFLLHELKGAVFRMREDRRLISITSDIEEITNIINLSESLKKGKANFSLTSFQLNEIVEPVVLELDHYLKPLEIKVVVENQEEIIDFDRTILKIVVKNLVKNAFEYLALFREKDDKYIRVEFVVNKGKKCLRVINPIYSKIPTPELFFEPHFSTKSQVTNSGLGLYFSREILEKNNATIKAFKNAHEITFEIAIPSK